MLLRSEVPHHAADTAQQQDEADDAPDNCGARRPVADKFFVRPVLRVGYVIAGTIGARCPRRPPKERRHLSLLVWVGEGAGGNRVFVTAMPVNVSVISGELIEGRGAFVVEHDHVPFSIVGIAARQLGQPPLQGSLPFGIQCFEIGSAARTRPAIQHDHRLAVQIISAPIRRDVGAMAPDRADLLASGRLPNILAVANIFAGEQHPAVGSDDLVGNGWRRVDRLIPYSAEHRERGSHDHAQRDP